jgi:alginate O-acetyltransferase complex protein AlgF
MHIQSPRIIPRFIMAVLLLCLNLAANAQSTGVLYDPEPPADSAYVRVIVTSREASVDVMVDGHPRIRKLGGAEASDYMVLAAGKHTIALHPAGKATAYLSTTIDVVRGRAMTLAFTALQANTVPVIFEDKANSNKLKALLVVYHLDAKAGPLDLLTADGNTKVFSSLAFGASSTIQVNPIAIELVAVKTGDKTPKARTSLTMTQGGTYSVLLLPGEGGTLLTRTTQNKIERYTGK